jgi:signal transduction histidine kinase
MENYPRIAQEAGKWSNSLQIGPETSGLRRRLKIMRWLLPVSMFSLVVAYQLLAARWFHNNVGEQYHYLAEILFYGTIGPAFAFILLHFLGRWLEERETSDLQAKLLAQAREYAGISNKLNDDALQTLFAARILINSIEAGLEKQDQGAAALLKRTETALEVAIKELREHLEYQGSNGSKIQFNGSKAQEEK